MIDAKNKEAVDYFRMMLFNRNQEAEFIFDEDNETFTNTADKVEYQIRDYTNRHFCSILVQFLNDTTHSYIEFRGTDYDSLEDLIYDALSESTLDKLTDKIMRHIFARN